MMEERTDLKAWVEYRDGIIHIEHYPGAIVDLHDMKKIIAFQKALAGADRYSLLIDMRGGAVLREAASSLVANNPNASQIKRVAIIANKGPTLAGIHEFIKRAKPNVETSAFLSEEEAREWLHSGI